MNIYVNFRASSTSVAIRFWQPVSPRIMQSVAINDFILPNA